jgi:histidyl-tRNA synthetase
MAALIEPKILKGFRDFLPSEEIARRYLLEKIETSFRSYGFVPIDTPALEYSEILLGKGGGETEKQIYRFRDNGQRDVALRFDLTVPFARFVAAHKAELNFPFKRYHIGKAWRGENTQRGRYREFTQCDFDIVGSGSVFADFEILHIMQNTLQILSDGKVNIHISHRGVFNRFLSRLGLSEKSVEILRTVDKLEKAGKETTLSTLSEITGDGRAKEILALAGIKGSFEENLNAMAEAAGQGPDIERLKTLRVFMVDAGIADSFVLDPSITRGLDYYTGVVFESFLSGLTTLGSVCSGGRYDNLVGLYSNEAMGGVGAAIGIDRLIAGLQQLGSLKMENTYAKIGIAWDSNAGASQALAEKLREKGVPCEVFLEEEKLSKQFQSAEKKGLAWLIIPGETLTIRNLQKRENLQGLDIDAIAELVKSH